MKLLHNGGSTVWSTVCTCNFWNCWQAVTMLCCPAYFNFRTLRQWFAAILWKPHVNADILWILWFTHSGDRTQLSFLKNVWVQRPFTSKFNNRYEPREQTFCLTSVYWCYFTMDSDNSERMRSNCLRWISYQLVHVRALMMWSGWFVLLILQFAICCTTVPIVE